MLSIISTLKLTKVLSNPIFLQPGLKPKLAIVDYKIGRNKTKYEYKPEFKKVLSAENKAGTISSKAIEKIKKLSKLENCLL